MQAHNYLTSDRTVPGARDRLADTEAELAAAHEDGLRLAAQAASADFELSDMQDTLAEMQACCHYHPLI